MTIKRGGRAKAALNSFRKTIDSIITPSKFPVIR